MTKTVEIQTEATEPCGCDGSGQIHYIERDDGEYPMGAGLVAAGITTHGTRLCDCRRKLPPREGQARWWTTEIVYADEWESVVHHHTAEVSVVAEVPVSDDNYVLHRKRNRYYPTMVDIDLSHDWLHALFPDDARALAAMLNAAADKCDEIDQPCACPTCGCWLEACDGHDA